MNSSLDDFELIKIASDLTGESIKSIRPINGGGNNRIYKAESNNGAFALKYYLQQKNDDRDRIGQEYIALSILSANGIEQVPKVIGVNYNKNCAVYEWIEGVPTADFTASDVDEMAEFLLLIQELRNLDCVKDIKHASASCISIADAVNQLTYRIKRLCEVSHSSFELKRYLDEDLVPAAETAINDVKNEIYSIGYSIDDRLTISRQALSPSDFGFHNSIRRKGGEITFIDFEYFGWDDPVKMICDIMWHPGMNLSSSMANRFFEKIAPFFVQNDKFFLFRFNLLKPIYKFIWCTIILNEFLPDKWDRRQAAGHLDVEKSKKTQLKKSIELFQSAKS